MRRKSGTLVPLEIAICIAAAALRRHGEDEFHGYEMAKTLGDASDARLLTAYGTLYRALDRLEHMGFLRSEIEDPHVAAAESRPGRRLYELTAAGQKAIADVAELSREKEGRRKKRAWSPL